MTPCLPRAASDSLPIVGAARLDNGRGFKVDRGLNPLTWKRRHLVTWAALVLVGGAAGLVFGWVVSPFSHVQGGGVQAMAFTWLHYPDAYLPYAAAGAITAGLAYYSADLLTGAR
jgi:hypothetical protein